MYEVKWFDYNLNDYTVVTTDSYHYALERYRCFSIAADLGYGRDVTLTKR